MLSHRSSRVVTTNAQQPGGQVSKHLPLPRPPARQTPEGRPSGGNRSAPSRWARGRGRRVLLWRLGSQEQREIWGGILCFPGIGAAGDLRPSGPLLTGAGPPSHGETRLEKARTVSPGWREEE